MDLLSTEIALLPRILSRSRMVPLIILGANVRVANPWSVSERAAWAD